MAFCGTMQAEEETKRYILLYNSYNISFNENTPLYNIEAPIIGTLLYFLIISYIQKIIPQGKSPYDDSNILKYFSLVHNIILCLLSFTMIIGVIDAAWERSTTVSAFDLICSSFKGKDILLGKVGFWLYIYYLSKYYELIDTIILVIKGKKVGFLHVYHHSIMIWITWFWIYYPWIEGSLWCVFVNSIIHFFMYMYYALSTLKYDVWWKKYLTSSQIIQFITGIFYVSVYFYYYFNDLRFSRTSPYFITWKKGCGGDLSPALVAYSINITFLYLFIKFYYETYKKKSN